MIINIMSFSYFFFSKSTQWPIIYLQMGFESNIEKIVPNSRIVPTSDNINERVRCLEGKSLELQKIFF